MTAIRTLPTYDQVIRDRSVYAQWIADSSEGKQTLDEVMADLETHDQFKLSVAENQQRFYNGEGIPVGGTTQAQADRAVAESLAGRAPYYSRLPFPVTFDGVDVDYAVKAQGILTGGDLKGLTLYADYLRGEVGAAMSVRSDVTFTGTWGKDRLTHDVNEYIGWLYEKAGIDPSATTIGAKKTVTPDTSVVSGFDPTVLAEANSKLNLSIPQKPGPTAQSTAVADDIATGPTLDELKAQLIASFGLASVDLDSTQQVLQQFQDRHEWSA